jgi:hypothetical protein
MIFKGNQFLLTLKGSSDFYEDKLTTAIQSRFGNSVFNLVMPSVQYHFYMSVGVEMDNYFLPKKLSSQNLFASFLECMAFAPPHPWRPSG